MSGSWVGRKVSNFDVFLIHLIFLFSLQNMVRFEHVVTGRPPASPTAPEGQSPLLVEESVHNRN